MYNIDEKKLNESVIVFDSFMNAALQKMSGDSDIDIVEVMTAYNVIKTTLSMIPINKKD